MQSLIVSTTVHSRSSLASAALRHVRDARHLAGRHQDSSRDQAWHLVGLGPECARKAMFADQWGLKALGHLLGDAGDEIAGWLAAMEPLPHRYRARAVAGELADLKGWQPEARYEATGTTDNLHRNLDAAVQAAERFTLGGIAMLWADGIVELGGEQ